MSYSEKANGTMLQTEHYCTEHHEHYVSENRCPKCLANNAAIKPALRASSELAPASGWAERLATRIVDNRSPLAKARDN